MMQFGHRITIVSSVDKHLWIEMSRIIFGIIAMCVALERLCCSLVYLFCCNATLSVYILYHVCIGVSLHHNDKIILCVYV